MSIDYNEQRDFIRMETDCTIHYTVIGCEESKQGVCRNLSATGVLFYSREPIAQHTELHIQIRSGSDTISALEAIIEVIRMKPNGNQDFEIAAFIKEILN